MQLEGSKTFTLGNLNLAFGFDLERISVGIDWQWAYHHYAGFSILLPCIYTSIFWQRTTNEDNLE